MTVLESAAAGASADSLGLAGKVVIVTGAGRGIGRAIALDYAARGARVVVNDLDVSVHGTAPSADGGQDRSLSAAEQVVAEITASGGTAVASGDSVATSSGARQILEAALDSFGRVDVVVNNAGILRDGIFHKLSEDDFDAVIAVHLKGAFNVSRAAAPHFRGQGSGAFVHMTSNSALIGTLGQANYMAAKLGIVGLSKGIALDMKAFGVRSNCVSPSAATRMGETVPVETEEQRQRAARRQSMSADRIAPLVVLLGSDAARDVTGQIFAVRRNEIFLMSQHRPVRALHRSDGWTADSLASDALPGLRPSFVPLDRVSDVFAWDPV